MKRILIRVDVSEKIGGGHLMRMIGLAEFLFDHGYEIHFASLSSCGNIIKALLDSRFNLHLFNEPTVFHPESDLENLLKLSRELKPAWIVLDGYHFPVEYDVRIKTDGFRLMRISDLPSQKCEADLLLNHNYGAESFIYDLSPNTIKLTGLRHLLLRREFRNIDVSKKQFHESGDIRLLVCLGGGSPITDALNLQIIQSLSDVRGVIGCVNIIVGKMGKLSDELIHATQQVSFPVNLIKFRVNIAADMWDADIAITAGGYSMWELLYLKTPFIAVSLNTEQEKYTQLLADNGICDVLGFHKNIVSKNIKEKVLCLINNTAHRKAIIKRSGQLLDRENNGKRLLEILAN